ncbi:MAG: hypothetical protein K2X93_01250 [Candidatus Obscuribacterales bacterium]|nr:hypothetical protein [Candidatus Obscuribacterales bacterium]
MSDSASAQILPPHPDAPGGGNPIQGLGRNDDPYPARYKDFVQPPDKSANPEGETDSSHSTESSEAEKSGEKPTEAAPGAGELERVLGAGEPQPGETPPGQARIPSPKELEKLREALEKHASHRSQPQLVPPPPPITSPQATSTTPERTALAMIKVGHFQQAETKLRELVLNEPNNMHARYLLAITLVHSRKFQEARSEYAQVVQNSKNPNLVQLAQAGLEKLGK